MIQSASRLGVLILPADVRYLVAVKRYAVTKEIRVILRSHFEDAFDSSSELNETLSKLEKIAEQVNQTIELLLDLSGSPDRSRNSSYPSKVGEFGRVWRLEQGTDDKEVKDFASWSALLLHMMIHKAYCILFHPIFRNAPSIPGISVREKSASFYFNFLTPKTKG